MTIIKLSKNYQKIIKKLSKKLKNKIIKKNYKIQQSGLGGSPGIFFQSI